MGSRDGVDILEKSIREKYGKTRVNKRGEKQKNVINEI